MNKLVDIHIGEEIAKRIKDLGISYADVARQLHVERTTIYSIIKSKSIDTVRLVNLSNILDYDFLSLYQPFVLSYTPEAINLQHIHELLENGNSLLVTLSIKKSS